MGRALSGSARANLPGFLHGGAAGAAPLLLGSHLVSTVGGLETSGIVVETEAYLGSDDPASHAFRGRTSRNDAMYGAAGTLYVYLSYGVHRCVNVVAGPEGEPGAVLVRALEPLSGTEAMEVRRGRGGSDAILCGGPGRLAQALGIELGHNRHDLSSPPIRLVARPRLAESRIGVSGRIGVSRARRRLLRFFVKDHPAVKHPRC